MRVQQFMRSLFSIVFLLGCCCAGAQSIPGNTARGSQLLQPTVIQQARANQATQQAMYWELEKNQHPTDANAWLNYFIWKDRDKNTDPDRASQGLKQTLDEAEPLIGTSWQYKLMRYLQSEKTDSTAIYQAAEGSDDKTITYPYLIQYLIKTDHTKELEQYCRELQNIRPMSQAMYEYHYNCFASAKKNATIYAKGLNDLVPLAILQQVFQLRKDVQLKYYEGFVSETSDSYLCLSVGKEILSKYPDASYTGLLIRLAPDYHELEEHFEKGFIRKALQSGNALTEEEAALYKNYLPGFLLLYKKYQVARRPGIARELKEWILFIGRQSNSSLQLNNILAP
jgi:hypothetical protein